jgi:hypothetical protein
MEHQEPNGTRFIDATGLSEDSIRALEAHVAALKEQSRRSPGRVSHEEWSKELHDWAHSHPTRTTFADWSRESIYADAAWT